MRKKTVDRERFLNESDRLASQGERVLALAWIEKRLEISVRRTVRTICLCWARRGCLIRRARGGIRVTMITGDHRITAAAIAKMPDIGDGKTAMTGAEMREMDTATLQERVRGVDVFARASSEHKLRLGQVATSSYCQRDLPDVISASLSRDAWALPRRSAGCLTSDFPCGIGLPQKEL